MKDKFQLLREEADRKQRQIASGGTDIAGVNQKITIEGIDLPLDAKIDTGNDGYNVLHAEGIEWSEATVKFNSHGASFEKDVVEKVEVLTSDGSSNRPVVQFDVEFLGKKYSNVSFSLDDRSKMDEPVLIGEPFLREIRQIIRMTK